MPQPSRDDVARETSPRFSCGTLRPAWTCTSGIESPAFTMAASERERFAAGGSVFALYEACGRAYNNDKWQCQPSEGEALSASSLGNEASRAVIRGTPRTTTTREWLPVATVRHTRVSHTRHHSKSVLWSAPASSRHALLVSHAPHAIEAIGEAAIVAIDRRKEPESITREQNQTTYCRKETTRRTRRSRAR